MGRSFHAAVRGKNETKEIRVVCWIRRGFYTGVDRVVVVRVEGLLRAISKPRVVLFRAFMLLREVSLSEKKY